MENAIELGDTRKIAVTTLGGASKQPIKKINLNYFPNDQTKHIDYVIHYKDNLKTENNVELKKIRNKFIKQIKVSEGFDIHKIIKKKDKPENSKSIYLLLNCPIERLMQEAERMHLELPLMDYGQLRKNKDFLNKKCLNALRDCLKLKPNQPDHDYVSAPFQTDIRFVFQGFEADDIKNCKGFKNSIRSMLVDNILKNMNFDETNNDNEDDDVNLKNFLRDVIESAATAKRAPQPQFNVLTTLATKLRNPNDDNVIKQKAKHSILFSGLPYMLEKKYFDDAFILQEESGGTKVLHDIMVSMMMQEEEFEISENNEFLNVELLNSLDEEIYKINEKNNTTTDCDMREKLDKKWASLKRVFSFQPLWLIRDYFGEQISLYFAFCGALLSSLWFPSIVGIAFFVVGVINSVNINNAKNETISTLGEYSTYFQRVFADSFDQYLTLPYAVIICLWGSIFVEYWKREESHLAYEWDTEDYEKMELDRVEYSQKLQAYRIKVKNPSAEFPDYKRYLKYLVSLVVSLFMIGIVAIDIALVVVYRLWITKIVYPTDESIDLTSPDNKNNDLKALFIGDVGSSVINIIFILIVSQIYYKIAKVLTDWENPRTQTEYHDHMILKLFAFEFVNSYGSSFYIAFFRPLRYPGGFFGLGEDKFLDSCSGGNCMSLLTIQVFVALMVKPFPRFFMTVILPLIQNRYKYFTLKRFVKDATQNKKQIASTTNKKTGTLSFLDFQEFVYVSAEKKKLDFSTNVRDEFMEKILLYGYIILFACSFTLGPLIFLFIMLIDIRVDAKRLLWIYRRPVSQQAQDIGMFHYILQFLNIAGIVSNGFIIAFTSQWGTENYPNIGDKLICVAVFEHAMFLIWIFISVLPASTSRSQLKMREDTKYSNELILAAKESNIKKQNIAATNSITNAAVLMQVDKKLLGLVNKNGSELNGNINETLNFNENEISESDDNNIVKRKSKKFHLTASKISPEE